MKNKTFLSIFGLAILAVFSGSGLALAQTEEELLSRGKYIFTAIQGCGCHTSRDRDGSDNMSMYLAGAPSTPPPKGPPANTGWRNPRWKRLYASNITPDPETGIGKWTESDFFTAMRTGLTPDGRNLDPFMPWHLFQGITDRDLKAMWVYLRTVKPIKNKVPKNIPRKK
jgi:hypothetical protein